MARLFVTDLESTLTPREQLSLMAYVLGDGELYVDVLTEQGRRIRGEVPWEDSFRTTWEYFARRDFTEEQIRRAIYATREIKPYACDLLDELKRTGIPTYIITGGIDDFIPEEFRRRINGYRSNHIIYNNRGRLVGVEVCVNGNKDALYLEICEECGIDPRHAAYMGDSSNDEGALKIGLPIAVYDATPHIKQLVSERGGVVLGKDDLKKSLLMLRSNMEVDKNA